VRVVLDSTLRIPLTAKVLSEDAATVVLCRPDADPDRRRALTAAGVTVREVAAAPEGLATEDVLRLLRSLGVMSLLVEGGGRVITSMLRAAVIDRLVVSVSPTIIGAGVEAVGPLGVNRVTDGIRLRNRRVFLAGEDVLLGFDVEGAAGGERPESRRTGDGRVATARSAQWIPVPVGQSLLATGQAGDGRTTRGNGGDGGVPHGDRLLTGEGALRRPQVTAYASEREPAGPGGPV